MSTTPTHRRLAGALIAIGAAFAVVVPVAAVPAAAPAPTPAADAALDWQAAQLTANGGTMPGFSAGSTDWGLTADTVLAFVAAGRATDPVAVTATDALAANAAAYTTWAPSMPEVRDAGSTGKTLLTLLAMGRPATAGGVNLETELRSLMRTSGPQIGRFSDRVPDPDWDAGNGFGHALSMLALALTPGGVPSESITFLVHQQCPAGGFRLTYSGPSCATDAEADTDTTALALQALLPVPRTPDVSAALDRAIAWLLARQDASGAFGGTGPTAAPNSNSTGLTAQALRAAGRTAAADRAAAWIVGTNQLAAGPDVGAIAYDGAARDAALAVGITAQTGDQWRRTTAQAVLGLGLSPFGPPTSPPVTPGSTSSTTSSSTSSSTPSTSTTSTTSTTSSSTSSTTSTSSSTSSTSTSIPSTPTTTAPARVESASASAGNASASNSPSNGSSVDSGSGLAVTGGAALPIAVVAASTMIAGALLLIAGRARS